MQDHSRPPETSDASVSAVGRLSEAFEYLVRARGHLYSLHQLSGRVDILAEQAADELEQAGHDELAERLRREIVGRNVLNGRWTCSTARQADRVG